MRYRSLGGTGIKVSVHCLGTMMLGVDGNPDHDECVRLIHAALDRGVNFVDTADTYSDGESEEIVGNALRDRRDEVVLATKVHFQMGEGVNRSGNSRRWILTAPEESLRRLQTDWIDLYQIHRPDPSTDIEETLSVLSDLVRQGKIRAFGCSTRPRARSRSRRRPGRRKLIGWTLLRLDPSRATVVPLAWIPFAWIPWKSTWGAGGEIVEPSERLAFKVERMLDSRLRPSTISGAFPPARVALGPTTVSGSPKGAAPVRRCLPEGSRPRRRRTGSTGAARRRTGPHRGAAIEGPTRLGALTPGRPLASPP
jgi:Aldo/keto reductase family